MKTAVITGASSGIGAEFAFQLADKGYHCLLIARRIDRLQGIAKKIRMSGGTADCRQLDLADADQVELLANELQAMKVDLLVNNAGVGAFGSFIEVDSARELEMLQLNMLSPVRLTRAVIPQMVERRDGGIIQVASMVAFQPTPFMAAYGATKSFLLHYSEAIKTELRGTGVHVMALCPGGTATEFSARAEVHPSLERLFTMSAAQVVNQALKAFERNKTVVITGGLNQVAASGYRFLPRKWITGAVSRMFRRNF